MDKVLRWVFNLDTTAASNLFSNPLDLDPARSELVFLVNRMRDIFQD